MRHLFVLLFTGLFAFNSNAQVSGVTKDANGAAINGVTISLLAAKDSSVKKLAVSKDNGVYTFNNIAAGKYLVKATNVGYMPAFSAPFEVNGSAVAIPEMQLVKAATSLKGVVVTSQKPMIEMKADKLIVNVEGTINAVGSDALDLLRKSPGVQVDKDENLSLSGKNGVQVYIDGRPSPLGGQDLANYLKSLNSAQIESIEIITNPSAKYEAAGNAGIINIRLKKNKSLGTNGSVNAGWNVGTYAKYNAGINLNYRNKKVNLFGNYSYSKGLNENTLTINRSVADSSFNQKGLITNDNESHNFKGGMDYFIDKKNTIGVMVNGTMSDPSVNNYGRTPIVYVPSGIVNRILIANNTSILKRDNINFNANYSYIAGSKSLTVNADHGYYNLNSNQYQPNMYYDATEKNILSSVIYRMKAPTTININSVKADWEQPFKKGTLGFGGKYANVKTDNDFQRYNVEGGIESLDKDRSNRFKYTENISAGYVNYNRAFKGMALQAGVRVENTSSEGISNGQKPVGGGVYNAYTESFKRSYTDFFPSAAITFNKKPTNQYSISYSRRIDRPNYQDLNPFEFKLDEYTFQKGNINLRPQYTNSVSVTNTYKYKLTTSLNYSHVKDLFAQVFDTAEKSKAFVSKQNLATQDVVSLSISYPYRYKAYSMFANVNSYYTKYTADYGAGRKIDVNAGGLTLYMQNSLKFAKTFTAEVTGYYSAPTVFQGTIKAKSMYFVDAGLQKQVLKGRATIKTSVSDVFHTFRFRGVSDFAGQRTDLKANWESRQFKLNFVYRFGSSLVKAARQRATGADDEMKRVQSGGGVAPVGN